MIQQGSKIQIVRDDKPPRNSTSNTRVIAASLGSGASFASDTPFIDAIEEVKGVPTRQVTWCMSGDKPMEFVPDFKAESIDFVEFARRFNSLEWCEANANHPIAYMRAMSDQQNRLRDFLRDQKPMVLIRKGRRSALIPADCPAARREEILALLGA